MKVWAFALINVGTPDILQKSVGGCYKKVKIKSKGREKLNLTLVQSSNMNTMFFIGIKVFV